MRSAAILIAACFLSAAPTVASAGATSCWYDRGVLVAPAEVLGVAGDYILDTGTPQTVLAETQAQAAGFAQADLVGAVRLAGLALAERPVAVAAIDVRTGLFPTPIAGVIGADLLRDLVFDVRYAPCRIGLYLPGKAPPFRHSRELPLRWEAGRPAALAAVSDGARAWQAHFALATGADRAVRLADDSAAAPGAAPSAEAYPYGTLTPRLRALSFADALWENLPAGLMAADPGPVGQVGPQVLARYRLRFDFVGGRLLLAPLSAVDRKPGSASPTELR